MFLIFLYHLEQDYHSFWGLDVHFKGLPGVFGGSVFAYVYNTGEMFNNSSLKSFKSDKWFYKILICISSLETLLYIFNTLSQHRPWNKWFLINYDSKNADSGLSAWVQKPTLIHKL